MEPTTELHICALVIQGYILHGRAMEELPKVETYAKRMTNIIDKLEQEVLQLRRENAELIAKKTAVVARRKTVQLSNETVHKIFYFSLKFIFLFFYT